MDGSIWLRTWLKGCVYSRRVHAPNISSTPKLCGGSIKSSMLSGRLRLEPTTVRRKSSWSGPHILKPAPFSCNDSKQNEIVSRANLEFCGCRECRMTASLIWRVHIVTSGDKYRDEYSRRQCSSISIPLWAWDTTKARRLSWSAVAKYGVCKRGLKCWTRAVWYWMLTWHQCLHMRVL